MTDVNVVKLPFLLEVPALHFHGAFPSCNGKSTIPVLSGISINAQNKV